MNPDIWPQRIQRRLTPAARRMLRYGWEALNFGILGPAGFVMLYLHSARSSIQAVVGAGMAGYALALPLQAVLCRGYSRLRRLERLRRTKTVFRLIYTAIYLTAILLDILTVSREPGAGPLLACRSVLFGWVCLWGTNGLWGNRLWRRIRPVLAEAAGRLWDPLRCPWRQPAPLPDGAYPETSQPQKGI